MKLEQITSPSLAWLLPSPLFWKNDEVLVQTDKKNFTLNNLEEFFTYVVHRLYDNGFLNLYILFTVQFHIQLDGKCIKILLPIN